VPIRAAVCAGLAAFAGAGARAAREAERGAVRPLDLFELGAPAFTTFGSGDGVPEAAILALATDAEGFVWLTSSKGLARYDGHRWEPAPQRLAGQVVDLVVDHRGRLGTALYDRGLAEFDGVRWRSERRATGLPTDHFRRLVEMRARTGEVESWALSVDAGLLRRVDGRWLPDPGSPQLPRQVVLDLARTREIGGADRLWVGTGDEGLWFREEGGARRRFRAPGFDPSQVDGLLATRRGGREELWIAGLASGCGA
jgi:ligand-binding sensor domain-containing protein